MALEFVSSWQKYLKFINFKKGNKLKRPLYFVSAFMHQDTTSGNKVDYDIVISGGGMVGFATGCALGQSKRLEEKKILLLEKQPKRKWSLPSEFSNRVCALNSQTQWLFSDVGAWDIISGMRAQPVKKMQVWESCSEALITFAKEDRPDNEVLAHIVENDIILDSLKKSIPDNVTIEYGSSVLSYNLPKLDDDKVKITLHDGREIATDLLVGADGAFSGVRKAMNCQYLTWEYDQMGIVATLELSEEEDNFTAWQKFLSTGPIAILPLSSSRCSLVWSTTRKEAQRLVSLSEEEFADSLNNVLWQDDSIHPLVQSLHSRWQTLIDTLSPWTSGGFGGKQIPPSIAKIIPRSRASFPLGLGHATRYVGRRVALIGDAAHRVHPLAGQGVNLGFGDVICLRATVEDAILRGSDIGHIQELHKYETERQRYNVVTMSAVDLLYRLYSTKWLPIVLLRSMGLSAVDTIEPLKNRIMGHASG